MAAPHGVAGEGRTRLPQGVSVIQREVPGVVPRTMATPAPLSVQKLAKESGTRDIELSKARGYHRHWHNWAMTRSLEKMLPMALT